MYDINLCLSILIFVLSSRLFYIGNMLFFLCSFGGCEIKQIGICKDEVNLYICLEFL